MASSRRYKPLQEFSISSRKGSYTPEEAAQLLREAFGLPQQCYGETDGFKTLRKILAERRIYEANMKILITGRVGRGKSTLINSIIEKGEEVATEGADLKSVTNDVHSHSYKIADGIEITLVDSPGLQHGQNSDKFFGTLVEDLMIKGDDTSLVLYCRKMTEQRFEDDELKAIRQLYQAFGPRFWERVVIVFTFANEERSCEKKQKPNDPPYSDKAAWKLLVADRFHELVEKRSDELKEALRVSIPMPAGVVDKIRFVPAGDYKDSLHCPEPYRLPDRENWLYNLLGLCCSDASSLSLNKLSLRENLHLAIIIDNEGEIAINDSKDEVALNNQAKTFKNYLEKEEFMVLSFNSLSPQSASRLIGALTTSIQQADLAAFALIILRKGKNCTEIDMSNILAPFSRLFPKVPKLFITHFAEFKKLPSLPADVPPTSVFLNISSMTPKNSKEITDVFQKSFKEVYTSAVIDCFETMCNEINALEGCTCQAIETFGSAQVLPNIFKPQVPKADLDFRKKKLDIQRVIWRKVRSDTVDALYDNKDEIRTLLRKERIARITTSVAGIVIGGGLVVGGIAAAPFTFGGSIGLSVAGGAVGAAAGMGGISALITRKVMANGRLKKAQEQINFDQQLSKNLNKAVTEYYEAIQDHLESIPSSGESFNSSVAGQFVFGMGRTVAVTGTSLGAAAAIGAEGIVEGSAFALRTTGRVAGMALAGASLAVTVPIDLAFIAYHSYRIHQANNDEGGAKESDEFVKWFIQQIKSLLIDTVSIAKFEQTTETEVLLPQFGFHIKAPLPENTVTVRTLFSGPFIILPKEAILVSAVYDVSIKGNLKQPAFVEIEHCVDVTADKSITKMMSFAVGTLDFAKKAYTFTLVEGGGMTDTKGTIAVAESSLLCIVYTGPQERNPIKYSALCAYVEEYRNSWNLNIMFTKYLSAHLQFFQREFPANEEPIQVHQFKLQSPITGVHLERLNFDDVQSLNSSWVIAIVPSDSGKKKVSKVTKKQLDTMEIQHDLSDSPVLKVPSIELYVQVTNEDMAVDQLNHTIHVPGTSLMIPVHRIKKIKKNIT